MNQVVFALLLITPVPLTALGFWLTIRARTAKQQQLLPAPERPESNHSDETAVECQYLATTFADNPLERVWAYRLGGRGLATAFVGGDVVIQRRGEPDLLIARRKLVAVESASATIDRGVERGGLTNIHWMLGDTELITSLRIVSIAQRREFEQKIGALIAN